MLSNFRKNSTLAILLVGLVSSQFGCAAAREAAENPAVWGLVITAVGTGTAVRAEARQSEATKKTDKINQQNNEVLVSSSIPVKQSNGTVNYSKVLVYVDCRDILNDSAIIKRNNITLSGKPLSFSNQTIIARYIRDSAEAECQKKLNKA